MSDTMTEGVIAGWLKKVGDTIKSGDILAEVETDKATMELESYNDGTLLYITDEKTVPIDGIIAIVGKKGEEFKELLSGKTGGSAAPKSQEIPAVQEAKPTPVASAPAPTAKVNATLITMPQMTDTMAEGTVAKWHKQVGDSIKSGDLLAEIETDKATMDFESPETGTLLYVGCKDGESIKAQAPLAIIGEKGADFQALLNAGSSQPKTETQPAQGGTSQASAIPTIVPAIDAEERIKISPLAKKLAEDKGVDIQQVRGSGENGRIVKRDVETFTPSAQPVQTQQPKQTTSPVVAPALGVGESYEDVPLSQMRKVIARRLAESMYSAPHFYLTMEINMDKMMTAREQMNELSSVKISFNDIVMKAAAMALRKHPAINAAWLGDKIRYNHHVHIGMAVAVPEGLVVPVIRNADTKSMSEISAAAKEMGGKAKEKKLQPQEMEGSTFSVSNLGMFGIEEFTAIINPPNACILAVGGIKQTPVVKNGEIKIGNIMKVTLSCDHRVVDGATGADFLRTLKGMLEEPLRLLV